MDKFDGQTVTLEMRILKEKRLFNDTDKIE